MPWPAMLLEVNLVNLTGAHRYLKIYIKVTNDKEPVRMRGSCERVNMTKAHSMCTCKSVMKPSVLYHVRHLWLVVSILLLPGRQQCRTLSPRIVFITLPSLFNLLRASSEIQL